MILTITINPLLERRLVYDKIINGSVNRTNKDYFCSGGKGINISRQLNSFGIQNLAVTFLGGNNGKVLRNILTQEKIDFSIVSSKNETRQNLVVSDVSKKEVTTFFGKDSEIFENEADEMISRIEKMIMNASVIVFSGSAPSKEAARVFVEGIKIANKYDKVSVLDTYGEHLSACLDAEPTLLHNNINELESSLNIDLSEEKSRIDFLNNLYKKNIKLGFITNGSSTIYASKFDFIYKLEPAKIEEADATGSGDAFVSGLIYGLENSLVFDEFFRIATAAGTLNAASFENCRVKIEEVKRMAADLRVVPVGKKMKLIDDQPAL